jgi:hypothetical protein
MQTLDHVMGDVVALAFNGLDSRASLGARNPALGHVDKSAAPLDGLLSVLFKIVEERFFPGQKAHLAGCIAEAALPVNARSRVARYPDKANSTSFHRRPWHSPAVTENKTSKPPTNLIALSDYRAQLVRGQRTRRTEALFDADDPASAIRALPPDEFFYVIHELGFPEAMDILVHGTAEQVQTVLDFALWENDRVSLEKADDWLGALVEAPPEALGKWAEGLDVELLALLVRLRARIYDLSLEEEPDEPEGVLWNSPDRLFVLEFLGEPDRARVTQHLVDSLYRYSPVLMRRLLIGMRSEFDAELEETAYRWRSGRMEDLGFVDFYEALEVYRELDPATIRIDGKPAPSLRPRGESADATYSRLPLAMIERMAGKTPFARAVAGLTSRETSAEIHFALVALCNRALSADRITPSDDEAIQAVLERVSANLDLAIEFLARGDAEREVAAVCNVPLVTLHRLGVSLVGKLRRLSLALSRGNPFAALRPAVDIFEAEDGEILASLTRLRPRFPRILEAPPTPGERPFLTLADIAIATRAVERAAAAIELVTGLGVRPQHLSPEALELMASSGAGGLPSGAVDPAAIDTGVLARTVLALHLMGEKSTPVRPLSKDDMAKFKRNFTIGPQLSEECQVQVTERLRASCRSGAFTHATNEVAQRWIASLCPLGPVLGAGKL